MAGSAIDSPSSWPYVVPNQRPTGRSTALLPLFGLGLLLVSARPAAANPAQPAQTSPSPALAPVPVLAPVPEKALPPPEGQPPLELQLSANRQSYDQQRRRYVSTGNVMASLAGGRLLADRIEFDPESRTLYAYGSVRFQRGQQYLQASSLRYSLYEGVGEMRDVYGVLDLDGTAQDLDLATPPSTPLPPPQPISCPPDVPPPPQWHPHPWAVTGWAGQMYAANFGDTFLFKGKLRPEYLGGLGLQRRLLDGGPFALEIDTNLLGHRATRQAGGEFNQKIPFADTPAQTFSDMTVGLGMRLWVQPWLSLYFVEGVSLLSENSNYERTFRENYTQFLNYLAFEVEALVSPQWSAVGRIHHRSGAYGTYSGVSEGSNAYLLGLRYRYGESGPSRQPVVLAPAQGCPGAPAPGEEPVQSDLAQQLEQVTLGPGSSSGASTTRTAAPAPSPASAPRRQNRWEIAKAQEKARQEAIARIDQRVENVQFQQSLTAERRVGFPNQLVTPDAANQFGQVRPSQLQDLTTKSNRQLVRGSLSRWRIQAGSLRFTPTTLSGDRVGFTNDPYTPAQSWLDSENVVATLQPNGDTVIKAGRNHLLLEERLPIPVTRSTRIKKQEEIDNRWVLGNDREDRDGVFLGYNIPIKLGEQGSFTLQPQFMLQRAINGTTDAYPLPDQPVQDPPVEQPATTGDLFGLEAKLLTPLAGFRADATVSLSSLDSHNLADGTRSWGDLSRAVPLPLLGDSLFRLFGAYRFRTWNGSLGEEDVYSAYGVSLEDTGDLASWGKLRSNYFWRLGVGNYQGNDFESTNLSDLWRGNAIGSLNMSLPLWTGKASTLAPALVLENTPVPIVPGLSLNANLLGSLAYYGDGTNQNTLSLSGGPTLTLGHFIRPFLDYTQITITGGGTLRQGLSPLSFDRAVDLGTVGIGLTQQIAGPLLFSGGIGYNVDPNSEFYGDVTASYVELRWQRRSYEIGVYYSPYDGLGGVRVRLNDFNFKGPGLPFVPYHPSQAPLHRSF